MQPHGPVSVGLDNSGTISLFANAAAVADDDAFALGAVTVAMQVAEGTSATVTLTNSGDISATAEAAASGAHLVTALAFASGLHQTASAHMTHQSLTVTAGSAGHYSQLEGGVGPASVSMTNSGTISLDAHGVAAAGTPGEAASSTSAFAAALGHIGIGILQQSFGSEASASLENSGTISFAATATAVGAGGANAQAEVDGFTQVAIATAFLFSVNWAGSTGSILAGSAYIGPAVNEFDNSGTFDVTAVGKAEAGGFANANVHATGGLQLANGSSASIVLDNSGTFNVLASGEAAGASGFAFAAAHGVAQWEKGADAASMQVINSGTVSIDAEARGTASQGSAVAAAQADGFSQSPLSLATATASVSNSGEIDIKANAAAAGNTLAYAFANAEGVIQEPLFGNFNANFANDGTVDIAAVASASASGAAYASARATGYYEDAGNVTADVVNSGTMTISASAVAHGSTGSAYAFAGGITMVAANHMSSTTVSAGLLGGSIVNSGELDVSAKVDSDNGGTAGATATGIYLLSTRNDATVVNSGTIDVAAVTAHGGAATAWGVRVLNAMRGDAPTADDLFTFTNDGGTIIARHSTDGGETWQRGMAIDVSDAPNASVINLTGNGAIYGNVAIQAGDDINVADGTTYFDGIINPQSMPLNGIHAVDLDSGLAGVGTLNIQDGGNLVLADPKFTGDSSMYDGPAYALVDTLNMDAGGTLTFELQPMAGGTQPAGSYPQIFADTANLDGILVADITTANGLFADSYAWNNVIDANTLSGKFDQCKLGGPNAGSVLLKFACSYDQANADVDLALTRVAFDQVAGLNSNGAAAGAGLECIYDDSLTGGAATMFADLFLIKDSAKYDVALNQLSGSAYANYLNSFPSLGAHYDDLVDHATDCEVPAVGGSILECRGGSPVHVWGQLDYQTRRADGDIEAGSSRSKRFTGMVGLDAVVGDSAILGFEAGYVTNHLRDRQFGDSIEGKGAQAGIYAAYDPGAFFVKGMTTFSWFNGDSTRHVDFTGLATGATFKGTPTAHPDANLWTFGLHGGARFGVGESSVVTPYLNLDYAMSRFNGFTETGLEGADLSVETSHSNRTFVTGGIKWAARLGGVVPEVNLGYRYRFGNERSRIAAFFSGDSDCDFDVVSAAQRKGAFLAGVSVGGKLGPVDVRIGYEGEFNRDVTSHSGNFKLVLPLGGHAAPPPPVAVPAPLAAPEPAPTEVAPTPAPAPVERGERGR